MRPWTPLLEGPLAEEAWDAIDGVARAVERPDPDPISSLQRNYPMSLAFGRAGIGLFYAYLGLARQDEEDLDRARECLEESLAALSDHGMPADLFRGFAGIGWAYEHTRDLLWDTPEEDGCRDIDEALRSWAETGHAPSELMHGIGGVCLYALERPSCVSATELLQASVTVLERQSTEFTAETIAWPLPEAAADRLLSWLTHRAPREFAGLRPQVEQVRSEHGGSSARTWPTESRESGREGCGLASRQPPAGGRLVSLSGVLGGSCAGGPGWLVQRKHRDRDRPGPLYAGH